MIPSRRERITQLNATARAQFVVTRLDASLMGELLEYLVPIIVGALYLLSQFFSKGSQEEDPAPGHRPGRPDPEVLAREQEIRDQIRRKIQERRQALMRLRLNPDPGAEPQQALRSRGGAQSHSGTRQPAAAPARRRPTRP